MANAAHARHVEDVMRTVHGQPRSERDAGNGTIATSWARCANDYRLDPARSDLPLVVDTGTLETRRAQYEDLVAIAAAEIDRLYTQISGSGYALLLTDAGGIILYEKVDPTLKDLFRNAGLMVGADWSEKSQGTNGMGTCIAERKPVMVHRNEHFRAHLTGLTCFGAPIRGPVDEFIAVLDASCIGSHDTRAAQVHTMALVKLSAHIIEKCLFLRHHQHHLVLRFHRSPELVDMLHDGALALAEDGAVIGADHTAAALLEVNDRYELVGRSVSEIFDSQGEDFLSHALLKGATLSPVRDRRRGRRYYVSLHGPVRRARSNDGRSLARRGNAVVQVTGRPISGGLNLDELAGEDPQMLRNVRSARRIVDSGVPVLIQGPTGCGKETFAHAMHLVAKRAARPFVTVNCAAIPETLIESELFGHKAGTFNGTRREGVRGKILQSSGGTLFLDDVGDMPLALQTRLLRVLEEQEVVPLGGETPTEVDLHVIAASHHDLNDLIARGSFRGDLYYRLNGITIELPALADREDRERVIHRVLAAETGDGRPAAIEVDALQHLVAYRWPGNVRELRNVIRTALAICEGGVVRLIDLPREIREPRASSERAAGTNGPAGSIKLDATDAAALAAAGQAMPSQNPLEAAERAALVKVIEECRGNMTRTAAMLGMSRNTLYRKMKQHGIPLAHG